MKEPMFPSEKKLKQRILPEDSIILKQQLSLITATEWVFSKQKVKRRKKHKHIEVSYSIPLILAVAQSQLVQRLDLQALVVAILAEAVQAVIMQATATVVIVLEIVAVMGEEIVVRVDAVVVVAALIDNLNIFMLVITSLF